MSQVDPKRDIWGALINENKDTKSNDDKHFLFVGAQKSGKTTIQNKFFSRRENPNSTLAIVYQNCQIRNNNRDFSLHFWEIGSGTKFEPIIDRKSVV